MCFVCLFFFFFFLLHSWRKKFEKSLLIFPRMLTMIYVSTPSFYHFSCFSSILIISHFYVATSNIRSITPVWGVSLLHIVIWNFIHVIIILDMYLLNIWIPEKKSFLSLLSCKWQKLWRRKDRSYWVMLMSAPWNEYLKWSSRAFRSHSQMNLQWC